tara:strand:+ start:361 stop:483 length:123 start_codon:yes stop_codon:yes gene_type:complete
MIGLTVKVKLVLKELKQWSAEKRKASQYKAPPTNLKRDKQ